MNAVVDIPTLRLSYSSLNTFSSCARKFELDKTFPKRARDGDNYAADVGSAIHRGYQDYLVNGDRERAIWEFMQGFPFVDEYSQTNDYRNFDASLSTLELMFDAVKMAEYELAKIMRPPSAAELLANPDAKAQAVPAIEVPFEIRFKGITIPPCPAFELGANVSIIGYIDAILQHYLTSLFRSMDIKTSRINLADATGKYKFDSQQVPYGIVVEHVAQGAVENFEVLYLDCYLDLTDPRVTPYAFMKTSHDIGEWCTNKIIQIQQISRFLAADYFPRTDGGCLFYNKPCRYLEICASRDRAALTEWFLLGEEPAAQEPFEPWIIADVEV